MSYDRARDRDELRQLKDAANLRMRDVLASLGVRETARGRNGTISICDPMTGEKNPSLVIWIGRPGGLSWKNFATGDAGDIINLVAYFKGWWHRPGRGSGEAIRWLKDLLGFHRLTPAERAELARAARIADTRRIKDAAADLEGGRRWARGMFFNAEKSIAGTALETYLRERRGIALDALPRGPRGGDRTPQFLRFVPRHRHVDEAGRETFWPCALAACVDPLSGEVLALHRTWLAVDGRDKAPVAPPRKCFPDFAGLIIPVWKGDSRMTVRDANAAGLRETLGLTEGWEDALPWAIVTPARRCWAAISLSNIGNVKLPDCIDAVMLHRQNDWTKLAAVRAFEAAKRALEAQGRPVAEIAALYGKDLSDTYRGAAA